MLSFEWRELETLCNRLSELRHRHGAAQRSRHAGLVDALKLEIARARRQRDLLVRHIAARLGSFAAEHHHHSEAADHGSPDPHDSDLPAWTGTSAERSQREPLR